MQRGQATPQSLVEIGSRWGRGEILERQKCGRTILAVRRRIDLRNTDRACFGEPREAVRFGGERRR